MTALILATLLARDATPEKTVQGFVDALNAHNPLGLTRRVVGGQIIGLAFTNGSPKLNLSLGETTVQGDTATLQAEVSANSAFRRQKYRETVELRRIDGDWKIVAPNAGSLDGKDPAPLALFAVAVANYGQHNGALRAVEKSASLSNVKQIAIATLMYAQDHNERLPNAASFKSAVMPYLRNADLFTAPGEPKGTVGYFLDPRLSGTRITKPPYPAETAMVLQGTPKKTAFPYAGKTAMAFLDGHAKIVDAAAVQKARAKELK